LCCHLKDDAKFGWLPFAAIYFTVSYQHDWVNNYLSDPRNCWVISGVKPRRYWFSGLWPEDLRASSGMPGMAAVKKMLSGG
jgi:hypothetical protein